MAWHGVGKLSEKLCIPDIFSAGLKEIPRYRKQLT
jgi:hypothetical protein